MKLESKYVVVAMKMDEEDGLDKRVDGGRSWTELVRIFHSCY